MPTTSKRKVHPNRSRSENDLKDALDHRVMAINVAVIPSTTLNPHVNTQRRKKFSAGSCYLGVKNEIIMATHIKKLQTHGFAPTQEDVCRMAYEIAERNNIEHRFSHENKRAGKAWFDMFSKRNSNLNMRKIRKAPLARAMGMIRDEVKKHFDLLERMLKEYELMGKPQNIFNMAETEVQLDNVPEPKTCTSTENSNETVSVIACCNAKGGFLPPACIIKDTTKDKTCEDRAEGGMLTGSHVYMKKESAHVTSEIFFEWLKNNFTPLKPHGKVLLILHANASSFNNAEMLEYLNKNDIILFYLPPQLSRFLQPLEWTFFKLFKAEYYLACNLFRGKHHNRKITRLEFGMLLSEAWNTSASIKNGVEAFEATGVCPFNPNIIPNYAFMDIDEEKENKIYAAPVEQNEQEQMIMEPIINIQEASEMPCEDQTVILASPTTSNLKQRTNTRSPVIKKNIAMQKLFEYDKVRMVQICQVYGCNANLSGDDDINMLRHIELKHPKEYEKYKSSAIKTKPISKVPKQTKQDTGIKVQHSEEMIWEGCILMAAQNRIPLPFITSSGFRKILNPLLNQMNVKKKLTVANLENSIALTASKIKKSIQNEVKDVMVCLKIDAVTRNGRGLIGIHIQYLDSECQLQIRTLAVHTLRENTLPPSIKTEILASLNEYNISEQQIYSITLDDGENMMTKEANLASEETEDVSCSSNGSEKLRSNDDSDYQENSSTHTIHAQLLEVQTFLLDAMKISRPETSISCVQCVAQSLVSIVATAMTINSNLRQTIDECRKFVTVLQTPSNISKINAAKLIPPKLDVSSRWITTYNMLESLNNLRNFVFEWQKEVPELNIATPVLWDFINDYLRVLEPIKSALLKLHSRELLYSDFMKVWLQIRYQMTLFREPLAICFVAAIERAETSLMKCKTFLATIYLDPRFKFLLSPDQNSAARKHLKKLHMHVIKLEKDKTSNEPLNGSDEVSKSQLPVAVATDLSSYLELIENQKKQASLQSQLAYLEIDTFSHTRLGPELDIMEYWKLKASEYPNLFKLVKILNAVPATQSSVQKDFDGLQQMLNDAETEKQLATNGFKNRLVIRLNELNKPK